MVLAPILSFDVTHDQFVSVTHIEHVQMGAIYQLHGVSVPHNLDTIWVTGQHPHTQILKIEKGYFPLYIG